MEPPLGNRGAVVVIEAWLTQDVSITSIPAPTQTKHQQNTEQVSINLDENERVERALFNFNNASIPGLNILTHQIQTVTVSNPSVSSVFDPGMKAMLFCPLP
jgi:hypothetical protein